jgi:hypothetical protein
MSKQTPGAAPAQRKGVWLSFPLAAEEVERRLGLSWGAAQKALLEACDSGQIQTQSNYSGQGPSVFDVDFYKWLATAAKPARKSRPQALVQQALAELGLPDDTPNPVLVQAVCKWHTAKGLPAPSRETVLRATGRRKR